MESLLVVWRTALFISTFAFPQLFGVLLYFKLSRAPKWLAVVASTLAPSLIFLFLAPIFLFAGIREAQAAGPVTCGMPAFAAILILFTGIITEFFVSLIVQGLLRQRHKGAAV
jgi:hypothetical protein